MFSRNKDLSLPEMYSCNSGVTLAKNPPSPRAEEEGWRRKRPGRWRAAKNAWLLFCVLIIVFLDR